MKKFVLSGLTLFMLFCVPGFGASDGTIDCQGRRSVSAFSRPSGMIEIKQLECNQSVSIIGTEQGYVEIEIDKNMRGFVEARYVRMPGAAQATVAPAPAATVAKEKPRDPFPEFSFDVPYKDYPRFEVFGGYSFSHWGESDKYSDEYGRSERDATLNMNGWNAAFTSKINSVFGIKGEVSGIYGEPQTEYHYYPQYGEDSHEKENGYPMHGYSIMVGPQITKRLSLPFDVFGHALFGIEHMREKREGTRWDEANNREYKYNYVRTQNAFAMAVGGGIDWKIGSLVIRAPQIDYFPWSFGGDSDDYYNPWIKNLRISAGVVFRFGWYKKFPLYV